MSLTAMLKGNSEDDKAFQTILRGIIPKSQDFQTISGKRPFSREYRLHVPYQLENTLQASLVGTGFDYLLRAMVGQATAPQEQPLFTETAAEKGMEYLFKKERLGFFLKQRIRLSCKSSLEQLEDFSAGKCSLEELIPAIYLLARLENIYRSGKIPEDLKQDLFSVPYAISNELLALSQTFQQHFLVDETAEINYNPAFGVASLLTGGADGDIIIGKVLYDVKTSKSYSYKWQEICQIVGYYFLHEIARDLTEYGFPYPGKHEDIKQVGFYRARYGERELFEIAAFYSETEKTAIKEKLMNHFLKTMHQKPFFRLPRVVKKLENYHRDLKIEKAKASVHPESVSSSERQ